MHSLLVTIPMVAIAEIGDKTQLLSLCLAARYRAFWPITLGILFATLLNHGISAWAGHRLGIQMDGLGLQWGASALFIVIGLWTLKPDTLDCAPGWMDRFGPFLASFIAFFIAEIGDKTQLATMTLATQFPSIFWVTVGTTIGMLIANVPAVLLGEKLLKRLPMAWIRRAAAALFILFGVMGVVKLMAV